jgi:glycoprotein-N-acetylgalactosamine 3-beta-galactosyltransferase
LNNSREYQTPFPILEPSGKFNESYDSLTIKVYSTIIDVYNNYNSYDWYLKADDDTYIFMDNLKKFLKNKNQFEAVTYGCNLNYLNLTIYQSGGAGYVLSREALNRAGRKLTTNYKSCINTETEDIDVAECIQSTGVIPGESKDEYGRERFHPFEVKNHLKGRYPQWFYNYSVEPPKKVCLFIFKTSYL